VKDDFLGDSFNVDEESAGILDISLFIERSIGISGMDGVFEFRGGKAMFLNKVIVDAGDVHTAIDESIGVDGFQDVRGYNELQRDSHRLASHWYRYRCTSNFWGCSH